MHAEHSSLCGKIFVDYHIKNRFTLILLNTVKFLGVCTIPYIGRITQDLK